MKYAREVIGLLGAHPGRQFRMAQILRHVCRGASLGSVPEAAVRKGVHRVLVHLIDSGQVERVGGATRSVAYVWKDVLGHEVTRKSSRLGRCLRQ